MQAAQYITVTWVKVVKCGQDLRHTRLPRKKYWSLTIFTLKSVDDVAASWKLDRSKLNSTFVNITCIPAIGFLYHHGRFCNYFLRFVALNVKSNNTPLMNELHDLSNHSRGGQLLGARTKPSACKSLTRCILDAHKIHQPGSLMQPEVIAVGI